MTDTKDGRLPDGTGLLQAEPEDVSALRAAIPDAVRVVDLIAWIDACWPKFGDSTFNQGVVRGFEILRAQLAHGHIQKWCAAKAMEAGTAETSGSVHDSAVAKAIRPEGGRNDQDA